MSVTRITPGADALTPDHFIRARRGIACIRLLLTVDVTMCGRLGDAPADFSDTTSTRYTPEHCTSCDAAYRAQHGVTPVARAVAARCERVECTRTAGYIAAPYGTPERLCRWHSEFHARTPLTV
jgi:hypothetical protein